jgi:hypothetical protein
LGGAFFLAMVLVGAHRCRQRLLMQAVHGGKWRRGRDNFRPKAGAGNILRPRARGKHELLSAGVFPPCGKPLVVITDAPSSLAKYHRPSRSDSTRTRMICVDPVGALPRPAGSRPIFCTWTDINRPEQTIYVSAMRRPGREALAFFLNGKEARRPPKLCYVAVNVTKRPLLHKVFP